MNRSLFSVVLICLFWLPACSSEAIDCGADCSDSEPTGSDISDPSTTQDPSDENEDDPLEQQSISVCLTGCNVAADCDLYNGQYTVYDADHYSCDDGGCTWLGCNSDAECSQLQAGYRCHPLPFTDFKSCVPGCESNSDCSVPAAGTLYDADNYECSAGACVFTGCNTNNECQEAQGESFLCVDPFNVGQQSCYQSCASSMDCGNLDAGPAYDANNYRCENNLCIYTGCMSDDECSQSFEGMVCVDQ